MTSRGFFITLEGGEGAGKSTQIGLLRDAFARAGIEAAFTREPGGTPQAEKIRDVLVRRETGALEPLTEVLLFSAARHEHIVHKIRPALERGQTVICDRFIDSTRAMQGAGMGMDRQVIESLYAMISGGLAPDLTVILDIDPAVGLGRSTKRLQALSPEAGGAEDRFERMSLAFHQKLRQGFLDIAAAEPGRCAVLDAAQEPTALHRALLKTLDARLGLKLEAAHG